MNKLIILLMFTATLCGAVESVRMDAIPDEKLLGNFTLKFVISKEGKAEDVEAKKIKLVVGNKKITAAGYLNVTITEILQVTDNGAATGQYVLSAKSADDNYSLVPGKPPKSDIVIVVTDAEGKMKTTYSGLRAK